MTDRIPDCHTLQDVNQLMIATAYRIRETTDRLASLEESAARVRAQVERTGTLAFLKAEGAMDLRKKIADEAEWDIGKKDLLAYEASIRAGKHHLAGLQAELDVIGKIGSNIKAEMQLR